MFIRYYNYLWYDISFIIVIHSNYGSCMRALLYISSTFRTCFCKTRLIRNTNSQWCFVLVTFSYHMVSFLWVIVLFHLDLTHSSMSLSTTTCVGPQTRINLVHMSLLFILVIGLAPCVTIRVILVSKLVDLCFPCVQHLMLVMSYSDTDSNWLPRPFICLFRCLVVCTIRSRGTPLLEKVEQMSGTAVRRDSNTHINTFGDISDISYPEFKFHIKHLGYFSSTMNSNMVSLKYDFEEFWSKLWLYTSTFADISADIPVLSNVDLKLKLLMIKLWE